MSDPFPRPVPRLPHRCSSRPATTDDAAAIHGLVAACERELLGRAETPLDAVTAFLSLPGLDLSADTLLVHGPDQELVGRASVKGGTRGEVDIHPGHRGRGIGTALLDWTEARARQVGSTRLSQVALETDTGAVTLLRSHAYEPFVTNWLLEIALPTGPGARQVPTGISVRPFRSGDEAAAYELVEDAFAQWQPRRKSFDEWARLTVERPAFAPALSPVAFAGDRMVGVLLALDVPGAGEGLIDQLAVRLDHRNRGIAHLLLDESFRAFHRRGHRTCTLWTHSETGALSLYERMGMTVRRSSVVLGKNLGAV
ncbi:GNAT family N-acetyltransferase [Streptomyces polygonati]|uniref:GNAT family N-acetyltransferase n=1 Tax=Streptomyces polygonati TaxID=1617087 RepID=A0ABV8HXC3_9ACTN